MGMRRFFNYPIAQFLNYTTKVFYVSLRSKYGAGRIERRRNPAESRACPRHDSAQAPVDGTGTRAEPLVHRVSKAIWRCAEAWQRDPQAADCVVVSLFAYPARRLQRWRRDHLVLAR